MPNRLSLALLSVILFASFSAWAQSSAIGLWKTIDDHTGKTKSLVRISENKGEYRGKIEKLFRAPNEDQHPVCTKCEGAHKDQPVIGMTIITGMHYEDGEYHSGHILDPQSGKVYKAKMSLTEDGKKLNVRGYIGMPMLGRTQTWLREE